MCKLLALALAAMTSMVLGSCDGDSAANRRGVGASCTSDGDCSEDGQRCLPFKGGYCGIAGCSEDTDCPGGSLCVTHTDSIEYCFLVCSSKSDCNHNRSVELEANCSSDVTFADQGSGKACVPPSGN